MNILKYQTNQINAKLSANYVSFTTSTTWVRMKKDSETGEYYMQLVANNGDDVWAKMLFTDHTDNKGAL